MHRVTAGIQAAEPGYRRIKIHPQPGGGLTSASATYESVYGRIASAWTHEQGRMRLEVVIPVNTRAVVTLPGAGAAQITEGGVPIDQAVQAGQDVQIEIGSGSYCFEYDCP